jgi:hypothetical protein
LVLNRNWEEATSATVVQGQGIVIGIGMWVLLFIVSLCWITPGF